ncbi:GNAT family N-acetyltransferase [Micromonospora sp. DT233]|uniref:GNAT family N-acetyltransferase n=1 Tax=Micromonospora sp. DT233 TaxID=3393432 RepID=UPI003CF6D5D1
MITAEVLSGRAAILDATGHHPYVRHLLGRDDALRGWRRGGAVAWLLPPGRGPAGAVLGEARPAVELVGALVAAGVIGPGQRVHLPRLDADALAGRLAVGRLGHWDFRWTSVAPPPQPGEERVVRLTGADHPALAALIEAAFPSTISRPGDPGVVDWYGIRDGDRLVACGADRSRGDVGSLAGLAVAPDRRGRGLGAALTAAMTRALLARYDHATLNVYTDNARAARLHQRLGFTNVLPRTSAHLA